jgi:hypothetical protein
MEIEEMLYDLERLLEFDSSDEKVFEYFDSHYEIVEYLIENKEYNYYYWVGAYPNLKPKHLAIVEKVNQQYAVSGLLKNPNVSGDWLERKFKSKDSSIVRSVANHPNLPLKVFKRIPKMTDKWVIRALLENPSCPKEYLIQFFDIGEEETGFLKEKALLSAVTQNENLPPELFKKMVENHNDYYKYLDDAIKSINMTPEHIEILKKGYPSKKSNYFNRIIITICDNPNIKTNIHMQDYFCDIIYQELDNNYKRDSIKKVAPYIGLDNINKLIEKIHPDYLISLTRNPILPTSKVTNIIIDSKVFHVGEMYDGYDFTQEELYSIIMGAPEQRANNFFNKYKDKFDSSTLTDIFEETKDERYLPQEAKDLFLF